MNNYAVIFEFSTYFSETLPNLSQELNFVPAKGLAIYIDDSLINLPEDMENKGWFEVADVDYILHENVFVASLKELGEYKRN
ncbi:MAG: hypothetical protein C0594_05690 [Marinilabiliales bacterium]|nr:MAG: hypothetical protein C0594_05690 [Marinilabiliales bacterium]